VAGGSADTSEARFLDALLALSLARPQEALREARRVLAGSPPPLRASVAHQVAGVVLRDYGAIDDAVVELRSACRWARRSGDPVRAADACSSLGVALVMAGRTRAGLTQLDAAVHGTSGADAGRILVRRANAHWVLGRSVEALRDARRAVTLLARSGDPVWEVRALHHRAAAHLGVGAVAAADRDYARCEQLHSRLGQQGELANVRHERAIVAYARGDLPTALARLHDAERLLDDLGVFEPQLFVSRCTVLLAAGLADDALQDMNRAVTRIGALRGSATRRAELTFGAAQAAYLAGDPATAERLNDEALRLFRSQRRRWWAARAELLALQCRSGLGSSGDPNLLRRARRVAAVLESAGSDRAVEAHLVGGRLALAAGRHAEAHRHLRQAAAARRAGIRERAAGWLAQAMLRHDEGRTRAMLAACDRGLQVLALQLQTLGATELRTLVTAQGAELAVLPLRHAVHRRSARQLLEWSERWRAVALSVPPVCPPSDSALVGDLAALRHIGIRIDESQTRASAAAMQRERRRLETAVRRRVLQTPGATVTPAAGFSCRDLVAELGPVELIELVDVAGELFAVTVVGGRASLDAVGPTAAAEESLAHVRFALRREAVLRGGHRLDVDAAGRHLEARILGPAAGRLRGDALLVVPPGRLHAVPWSLLPSLRGRSTAVSPSASAWLRARRASPPPGDRTVLVGGPRLATGADEVRALARHYPAATVLTGAAATVDRVLTAMDGAQLVHIAAHGTFRADSPQFSAIELHDGPLTVYDLERLQRAPHRVVLANCNSGLRAPAGADELLGVVSALIALGSAGVVASVVPIADDAAVPLMLALHRRLREGRSLPQALALARRASTGSHQARIVASSFIALGS
jgi:tetratricopeptide (TPR) repeat protein